MGLGLVKQYFVYIMTNRSGTLYTGMTSNLIRRVLEHKNKHAAGFTSKYNIGRLVFFEQTRTYTRQLPAKNKLRAGNSQRISSLLSAQTRTGRT